MKKHQWMIHRLLPNRPLINVVTQLIVLTIEIYAHHHNITLTHAYTREWWQNHYAYIYKKYTNFVHIKPSQNIM